MAITRIWDLKRYNYDNPSHIEEVSKSLGVTKTQAEGLLCFMHSAQHISLEDLLSVPGIGPKTQERLTTLFGAKVVSGPDVAVVARIKAEAERKALCAKRREERRQKREALRRKFGTTLGEALSA